MRMVLGARICIARGAFLSLASWHFIPKCVSQHACIVRAFTRKKENKKGTT